MSAAWLSSLREADVDLMPFLEGDRRGGSTRRMRGELVSIDPDPEPRPTPRPQPEPEPGE